MTKNQQLITKNHILMTNNEPSQEEQLARLEVAVKSIMTDDARARLANLQLAYPTKAIQVMVFIAQLVQQNKVNNIDDRMLKELLINMDQKRETKIKYK